MRHIRSALFIFAVFFLLLTFIGLGLAMPAQTSAHPAYGFTPQPPPPPPPSSPDTPPSTGSGSENRTADRGKDDTPTDYILVIFDRCDLVCAAGYEPTTGMAVAAAGSEMLARVQLVHRGSGWITEGILSDTGAARLAIPYPGQWEVFLMEEPLFGAGGLPETGRLDMAGLRLDLANGPVSLGLVEANTAEPQLVRCPALCVIDPPPPALPVTGADRPVLLWGLLSGAAGLIVAGLLLRVLAARA